MKKDSYRNYIDQLNPTYREVYDEILLHALCLDGMSESRKDEKMSDLLDIMLSAQEEGKPVEKVCGKDVQTFCKEFFTEYDICEGIYDMLKSCRKWIWLLFSISAVLTVGWLFDSEVRQSSGLLGPDTNIPGFVLIIMIANILPALLGMLQRYNTFQNIAVIEKLIGCLQWILYIGCVVFYGLILTHKVTWDGLPVGITLVISVVLIGIYYYLQFKLKED